MRNYGFYLSAVVLLISATASSATVPPGSILVSTRSNAAGIVALDLNGGVVGGFVPQAPYDVVDVQQISPGGDILLGQHPLEGGGDLVSRYDSTGNFVANISGTPTGKYAAHLAISENGSNAAFAEFNLGFASSIDLTTNEVTATWSDTYQASPRGIDVGPDGYIYMAVPGKGIWKFSQDLSSMETVIADPQPQYADITFGPDGLLYASTYGNDGVVRYDVNAGTAEDFIPSGNGVVDLLSGLMFHPTTGNLLVSSYYTGQILEFNGSTGDYIGQFASFDQPWCISMAPAGATGTGGTAIPANSILVSTRGNAAGIVALDSSGNTVGGFVPQEGAGNYDVIDVQQLANGDILLGQHPVTGVGGDLVSRYDPNGNFIGNIDGTLAGKFAAHLAVSDPDDESNLAFIEHNIGGLSSIDLLTNQVVSSWIDDMATATRGVDIGPDGFLYMATQDSGIWKIAPDFSSWAVVAIDPQASYADITFGPDGKLYASTYVNNGVICYDVSTGEGVDFIASDNGYIDLLAGLMFHPISGNLLVSSYRTNQILEFDGTTGAYIGEFAALDQAWCISMAPGAIELIPGDASGDGVVNDQDAAILAANWLSANASWGMGDFNDDGVVNDLDATILAANWQTTAANTTVPEPGVLAMLLFGIASLAVMRRQKRFAIK